MSTTYIPGQWNAICDRCGFKFKSSELRKDWQGLMVCDKDFETRHPQSLLKIPTEKAFPEWTRPRPADLMPAICYIYAIDAYAGLGEAGCMQAGVTNYPYSALVLMKG